MSTEKCAQGEWAGGSAHRKCVTEKCNDESPKEELRTEIGTRKKCEMRSVHGKETKKNAHRGTCILHQKCTRKNCDRNVHKGEFQFLVKYYFLFCRIFIFQNLVPRENERFLLGEIQKSAEKAIRCIGKSSNFNIFWYNFNKKHVFIPRKWTKRQSLFMTPTATVGLGLLQAPLLISCC